MRILIDSDYYIATLAPDDSNKSKAQKAYDLIFETGSSVSLLTTWDVIDEVTTKLSYFISKEVASEFFKYIGRSDTLIIYPTERYLEPVYSLFNSIKSKNVSLTDCFNAVVFKEYEIDYILSFDKDYKKLGVKIWE